MIFQEAGILFYNGLSNGNKLNTRLVDLFFFCSHIRKISKSLKKAIHNIKTDNFNFMFEVNWKTICPYGRAA
jgi:hypothetical protein